MAFCRNCGGQLREESDICPRCGTRRGIGANFCPNCAERTMPYDNVCENCQTPLHTVMQDKAHKVGKSKLTAGLLGIFLGALGVHNFYLGYTAKAVAQLVLTIISCCIALPITFIWGLVEGILILSGTICVDGSGDALI